MCRKLCSRDYMCVSPLTSPPYISVSPIQFAALSFIMYNKKLDNG